MNYRKVKATERLPEKPDFYFCIVKTRDGRCISKERLLFGYIPSRDEDEDDCPEDNNFYASCDCILEPERVVWLEEIEPMTMEELTNQFEKNFDVEGAFSRISYYAYEICARENGLLKDGE